MAVRQEARQAVLKAQGEIVLPEFRDGLLASPIGKWTILQSKDGWHVVRLDSHRLDEKARFEEVAEQVDQMWRTDQSRIQAWEAVNRLKASYRVEYEK